MIGLSHNIQLFFTRKQIYELSERVSLEIEVWLLLSYLDTLPI